MLLVRVTLRRDDHDSAPDVHLATCSVPAQASLRDLQASIAAALGPDAALSSFTYRGCPPGLSTKLQASSAGQSLAPRFTARYTGYASSTVHAQTGSVPRKPPTTAPKQIQVFVKVGH